MDQSRLIDLAFDFCMRAEGNATYTDDPDDAGGPTKFGLALNYNRDVLPDKNGDGYINAADVRLLEREDARQVWERVYWRGNGCHLLPDALAFIYADMVFTPGPEAAAAGAARAGVFRGRGWHHRRRDQGGHRSL